MEPKSLIRIGYLFVILGVLITALLIYQTKDCPDPACITLLVYLSLVIMVTATVIFIITDLFAMRLWLKRKQVIEAIPIKKVDYAFASKPLKKVTKERKKKRVKR